MSANFQPFIDQLIQDQTFGYLLPNSLAIAALGANDKTIRQLREAHLKEGTHYLQEKSVPKRIYYTVSGLAALAHHLGTDRSRGFVENLWGFVNSQTAIVRRSPSSIVEHHSQPVEIQPVQPAPLYPAPVYGSAQMPFPPHLAAEIIQLKRDEIELRRDELETERMKLYRTPAPVSSPAPAAPLPSSPVTPTDDQHGSESQSVAGVHIHIDNHNTSEGGYRYDSGIGEAFLIACAIALFSAFGLSVLITSAPHREVPNYVR